MDIIKIDDYQALVLTEGQELNVFTRLEFYHVDFCMTRDQYFEFFYTLMDGSRVFLIHGRWAISLFETIALYHAMIQQYDRDGSALLRMVEDLRHDKDETFRKYQLICGV